MWDLHYPAPAALDHEFPISAIYRNTPELPLGVYAMPGSYAVKLTVDGKAYSQPLTLKMDPRIKSSDGELRAQFEMESGSVQGMNESFKMLSEVRSVREQLDERAKKLADQKGALADSIATLKKQLGDLEGGAQSSFYGVPSSGKPPENFSTLNQHFGNLLAVADSADAAPTTQAQSVYREVTGALQTLQRKWNAVRERDLPRLNEELRKNGQAAIDPIAAPSSPIESAGEGDDEP